MGEREEQGRLSDLNDDVIFLIFDRLDSRTLVQSSLWCRRFRDLWKFSPVVYINQSFMGPKAEWGRSFLVRFMEQFIERRNNDTDITTLYLNITEEERLPIVDTLIQYAVLRRVQSVSIRCINFNVALLQTPSLQFVRLVVDLKQCQFLEFQAPWLESFVVEDFYNNYGPVNAPILFDQFMRLTYLYLEGIDLPPFLNLPLLADFRLRCCSFPDEWQLPRLIHLELIDMDFPAHFSDYMAALPMLQSLAITLVQSEYIPDWCITLPPQKISLQVQIYSHIPTITVVEQAETNIILEMLSEDEDDIVVEALSSIVVPSPFQKVKLLKIQVVSSFSSRISRYFLINGSKVTEKIDGTLALIKSNIENVRTTPAGEYLNAAMNNFDTDEYKSLAALSDRVNQLLMLVLAAVIKAGGEHEILCEIRDSVMQFIRKMEPKGVMDTVLVSRVRILYLRSLISRSPQLQIEVETAEYFLEKVNAEYFLEKVNAGRSRSSSRGSSPGRSPTHHDASNEKALVDQNVQRFKINIEPGEMSELSGVVLQLRGTNQETWRHDVTGRKLRVLTEQAKDFAIGNFKLANLVAFTPDDELIGQIRSWLADNFVFLSAAADASHLGFLATAVRDGWMAGLGAATPDRTDVLGQLLENYMKYMKLQHLKDIDRLP